jgi:hypothetical protein
MKNLAVRLAKTVVKNRGDGKLLTRRHGAPRWLILQSFYG